MTITRAHLIRALNELGVMDTDGIMEVQIRPHEVVVTRRGVDGGPFKTSDTYRVESDAAATS